jgi:hypothetical protein
MASGDLQMTVDTCMTMQSDLTLQLTDIVSQITRNSKKSLSLIQKTNTERAAVKNEYKSGTDQYNDAMDDIDHKYQASLAEINEWEKELDAQKTAKETQVQEARAFKETMQGALKQNISTDYKYGGTGGQ